MNLTLDQLDAIVGDVLTTVGGLTVERRVPCPATTVGAAWVTSHIEIRSDERVELRVTCGRALAATLASAFFGEVPGAARDDDVDAAMLELANIVAGHVGASIEGPRRIGSPMLIPVVSGHEPTPDLVVSFAFGDEAVVVSLRVATLHEERVR